MLFISICMTLIMLCKLIGQSQMLSFSPQLVAGNLMHGHMPGFVQTCNCLAWLYSNHL